MKLFAVPITVWFVLISFSGNGQRASVVTLSQTIQISSEVPSLPVIKGLAVNPLICIKIYIPGQVNVGKFRQINCTLNKEGISAIEKLELYFTDLEPLFSTGQLLSSVTDCKSNFSIPVQLDLKPGWHYIWLSAKLKQEADITKKIELHISGLLDAANKTLLVKEQATSYKKYIGVAVRKANDDNVNTYRIPGIITTNKGTLIGVYDIRYKNSTDLPGNIDVGMSRSIDGGNTWQPMKIIVDMGAPHENNGVGDPAILFDPVTKKIWVAALWSKGYRSIAGSMPGLSPDTTGQLVVVSSDDDGLTWTKPKSITEQVKNPIWHLFFNGPGNGIAMKDGKIVFAAQYWDENKLPWSTLIYSADHGVSWKGKLTGPKSNTTESQLVETTPGKLMLNMRDNRGGFRSVATSSNMGNDWVEHFSSYNMLPDPVCMGSLIKATVNLKGQKKEVLFFSNPNTPYGRFDITVKASLDFGESWKSGNQLLIDQRKCFGYSALTSINDGTIGILYEGSRDLYFVRIPITDIIK